MAIALGLAVFGLLGGFAIPTPHPCLLGLTVNVSVNGGVKELVESIADERKIGCDLMAMSAKWSDLEPQPGVFKLDRLQGDMAYPTQMGFTPVLTIQTIDTNNKTVPKDLASEPWNSPKMIAREQALLKAVAAVLPRKIGAVMLGNEVDAYLSAHPADIAGYLKFLEVGRNTVKAVRPGTPIGVTTEFNGLAQSGDLIDRLQHGMDIVSMTYYPLGPDFKVMPVGDVEKHFEQMLTAAGSRKLFLQEAGYPAAPLLGSSEAMQTEFVDALFNSMSRHGARLFGVCFFLLVDFNDRFVDSLVGYYGLKSDTFRAYLSTLGLKKQDGTPRAAWAEFRKRASSF